MACGCGGTHGNGSCHPVQIEVVVRAFAKAGRRRSGVFEQVLARTTTAQVRRERFAAEYLTSLSPKEAAIKVALH